MGLNQCYGSRGREEEIDKRNLLKVNHPELLWFRVIKPRNEKDMSQWV